jgi:hypothetical protein
VKISVDQPIAATPEEAQAAFLDPAFYESLGELEGISAPQVRSFSSGPDHARIALGYRFSGDLNGPARALLDPAKLTWVQETDVDLASGRSEVRMVPDNYGGLLSFDGWYELLPDGNGRCRQHLEADLRVHIPLLGGLAERTIAESLRQNLAGMAQLLERYITAHRAGAGRGGKARQSRAKGPGNPRSKDRAPAARRRTGGDGPAS